MSNSGMNPILLAQTILGACPASCMIVDENGKIAYINQSLEDALGLDHDALLGVDQGSVPNDDLKALFSDKPEISLNDSRGAVRTFQHSQQSVNQGINNCFVVHYFLEHADDVLRNDNAQLHEEITGLRLDNPVTGLSTERALMMALESQTSRSRRYNNPLSIVKMSVEFDEKTKGSDDSCEQCQLTVSRLLKDQLRWADVIGQLSPQEFVFVLPETDKSAASTMAGKVSENLVKQEGVERALFGITDWKKGDNAFSMLHRAEDALAQAQKEDESSAVVL